MGAGGRDFHVFNTRFRDDDRFEVVAFTAAQIPHIENRVYPPVLAGPRYPTGIPILPEGELEGLISGRGIDQVVFAYSDVSCAFLEATAKRVIAQGARFSLFNVDQGLLPSHRPAVAICAVRTGCGKSPLARYIVHQLRELGRQPVVIRHPMPYGNLSKEIVQRFQTVEDLEKWDCTIEEREEYEPHIQAGNLVFAGADYQQVLAAAEAEADVVVWDGGNNDAPFIRPDLLVTVLDPLRAGHELTYFPGTWNFQQADVLVIAKIDEATDAQVEILSRNIQQYNPTATVIAGRLPIQLSQPAAVRDRRVLVVEDGPTITHGGMAYGAGYLAARQAGARLIVDPRPYAVGEIATAFRAFPHIQAVLPALGYAPSQLDDLQQTIANADCDVVVVATPIDLTRIVAMDKPSVRVSYSFAERDAPQLQRILQQRLFSSRGAI
ncbi:MAG: GTPase [Planctomycetales bacterium]|nr:GTPase [Planctomycetales bacterium]NIM08206.1 GTPase [Planctomycetales bacterium]NIN07700.1 GTPase [Planctomycetales bacterium]NIN76826.1 GTPase [Planctomycetales bacterium]NIO34022.1 GTPase [Planctomycetales bacterium]